MTDRISFFRFFYIFIFFLSLSAFPGVLEKEVTFNRDDISFTGIEKYDFVKLEGCGSTTRKIGAPCLPRASFSLLIPQGTEVVDIEVISFDKEEISGKYDIYPTQHPQPFMKDKVFPFAEPDTDIYSQTLPYPEKIVENSNTGSMSGYRLASVLVYPLQYIPAEKKLVFYSRIKFKVTYEENLRTLKTKTEKQNKLFGERVGNLILNPEDLGVFEPTVGMNRSLDLSPDTVEYVIITVDSFASTFQELADWKTKKGVPTRVVTLDSIYANYTGVDNAERIRNFIIDANSTWGTIWVLLGGQCDYEWGHEIVPRRNVYYIMVDWDETDTIPSDLYFSDLDGDWNADGDGTFGESTDNVDLYSDVFVGRAPVRTVTQAEEFLEKVLTYEKRPPSGYLKKILLPAAILWTYYDEQLSQEAIANMIPGDWQVSRMYERDGNLTHTAFVDSVRSGYGFAHLVGHGNEYGIYTYYADAYLESDDLDALDNDSLLGIHNSIGCMCGALDFVPGGDCFAEHYLTPSNGGSYSIMNSRYGWGDPPSMGPSEHIDTCFYHEVFSESYTYHDHIGVAHAFSKDGYVSEVTWSDVWAWCIYELNLFGDPEMPLWTDEPGILTVTHDAVIPVGGSSFSVNVADGGSPVEGALVCLYKEGEVYEKGYTDASGNITLTLLPAPSSLGTMYCTVTKSNYIPNEGTIDVISPSGPWVIFKQYTGTDISGNNDGNVDPGESIQLSLTVHNVGLDTAYSIIGVLRTTDSYVTLTDSTGDFGDILTDSLAESLDSFDFYVSPGCPVNHNINFELVTSDINDSTWSSLFSVPISTPDIELSADTLNFDTVYIGFPDTLEIIVNNDGGDTLFISNITSDNIDYSVDISNFNVPPDDSQAVSVIFSPASLGVSAGNLTIDSDDPHDSLLTVFLQGEGLAPPDISVSPDSLSDSLFTGETSVDTLTIYNTGSSNLIFDISIEETTSILLEQTISSFKRQSTAEMLPSTINISTPNLTDESIQNSYKKPDNDITLKSEQRVVSILGDTEEIFGSWDGGTWSGGLRDRGNVFHVDSATTLKESRFYLNISSSTQMYFFVYEGDDLIGTYTKIEEVYIAASGTGEGWYSSGPMEVNLDTGKYYYIGTSWEGTAIYGRGIESIPLSTSFGTLETGVAGPLAGFPPSATILQDYYDYSPYYQAIVTEAGPDWVNLNPLSDTIPAGDSAKIEITFDATGLNGGNYYADIIIENNDPDESEVVVPAHLHVTGAPDIAVSEDTLDYGTVFTGFPYPDTLIVSNQGTDSLTVSDISSDNTDYTVGATNFSLYPGETQEVVVTFTPSSSGVITGNLTITSDDPDDPTYNIFLQGEGLTPPDISVSPDSLSDTLFTGETSTHNLIIYNTVGSDLDFVITIEGGGSSYALEFDGVDDYVEVPDNPSLSAIGGALTLECWMNPGEYPFENRQVLGKWGPGGSSDDEFDLDLFSSGGIRVSTSGSTGGYDALVSDTTISPNIWTHIAGVFDSTNNSLKIFLNGELDTNKTPSTITLDRDTDQPFRMGAYDFSWGSLFKGQLDEVRIWNIARTQADIQADMYRELVGSEPGLIGYWKFNEGSGNTAHGSSPNNNDGTLYGGTTWVFSSSPIVNWIYVDTTSGTVPAGDSMLVEVTFDATGLYGGDYYSDIIVTNNDPDESEVVVPAHLHVIGAPAITVSDDTLDCGIVYPGYSVTDTLIVSNEGTDSLMVNEISSDNGDYTIDTTNFILAPEENQPVLVTFTPSSMGTITGLLTIHSNDPTEDSTLTVYMHGECMDPPNISVSPDSLSDTLSSGQSSTHTLTIYNTGVADLTFDISIVGEALSKLLSSKKSISTNKIRGVNLVEIKKGEEDTRIYPTMTLGSGGPDGFGYRWKDSNEPGGPTFNWIDASGGSSLSLSDDAFQTGIPLGFTFNYYGTDFTTIGVGSNGWLSFNGSDSWYPSNVPYQGDGYEGAIAPFARDLYPPSASYIRYQTFGSAPSRYFVIEYNNIPNYSGGNNKTFEVVFYENSNKIRFQYLIAPDDPSGFGIESPDETMGMGNAGSDSLFISPTVVENNYAIEFSIIPDWILLDTISGTVSSGDSVNIEVTFDATGLNAGDHFADITITSNDPDEPELIVPAYLHVPTDAIEEEGIPKIFFIKQNYPNPFNGQTTISYGCPRKSKVRIQVFDVTGRIVKTLIDKEVEAGYHEVKWEGENKFGRKIANAVYFYRIQAGDFIASKKMIFVQ